ncbi:Methylmalonate-semialdehyde dehydrogenase [Datura stramonium]|uniref:Methylmalonate-semialdehyde dehydrogenase [acylating], mitochondrial n=1 Tax=Datura stramonium TaxID=4076 RepID=A0ABS8SF59_DATST|nr:Methylmalonate-semialdehyde dehydrogenase [acylating], mitochondrial [Datura stramonium]
MALAFTCSTAIHDIVLHLLIIIPKRVPNLVGGSFVDSQSSEFIDVINPATQEVVSQIPLTTDEEFKSAVSAARRGLPDKLALNVTTEQGKTLKDAQGDVFRGLEVVEHACGMATLQHKEPLGVCGICPFNFPVFPYGCFLLQLLNSNTFVHKPSEKDPGASMMLAELAMEAGLPDGVLNIVHGTHGVVNAIM